MKTPETPTSTDTGPDAALERRIITHLDFRQETLTAETQLKLDRARRQALAGNRGSNRTWQAWPWLATASAACLALFLLVSPNQSDVLNPPETTDLDLLTMSEFDLLDQDPDFMAWLAEQDADLLDAERPEQEGSS